MMGFGNCYGGMGYQPAYYNPSGAAPDALSQFKGPYQQPQQTQQANSGLLWVQGEAGAKSFCVAPGQSALLMDSEAMRFYLKSADASGMPMPLRVFEYKEVQPGTPEKETATLNTNNFVTWKALDERLSQLMKDLKEETDNG